MEHNQRTRLGDLLLDRRGKRSRAEFARELELSYTFVREMEAGNRFPSEATIPRLASKLGITAGELALYVYCDRSPHLAGHLAREGILVAMARPRQAPTPPGSDGSAGAAPPPGNGTSNGHHHPIAAQGMPPTQPADPGLRAPGQGTNGLRANPGGGRGG